MYPLSSYPTEDENEYVVPTMTTTSWEAGVENDACFRIMMQDCRGRKIDGWVKHVNKAATKCGRLNILQLLRKELKLEVWNTVTSTAAEYGHINILEWVCAGKGV